MKKKDKKLNEYYQLDYIHKKYEKNFFNIFKKVFNQSNFILGNQVKKFENNFAKFVGTKYCIGVGNGFDALKLILEACKIGKGDEVIVSSHTFIATWHSISSLGAVPIPIDSFYDTYNLNTNLIISKITKKTKAIVAVHLYGQPVNSSKIKKICKDKSIFYFEDSSQAHGAKFKNKYVGSLGDASAFSFYPTKNIGALGDAGAVTTSNYQIYKSLKRLRNYGSDKPLKYLDIGYNSRLDEFQAAFLNFKLSKYNETLKLKNKIAKFYNKSLPEIENVFELPKEDSNARSVWHHYVVKVRDRKKLIKYLYENNLKTMIHYPIPPYRHKSYDYLKINPKKLNVTEKLHERILSLPTYDIEIAKKIVLNINYFYKNNV